MKSGSVNSKAACQQNLSTLQQQRGFAYFANSRMGARQSSAASMLVGAAGSSNITPRTHSQVGEVRTHRANTSNAQNCAVQGTGLVAQLANASTVINNRHINCANVETFRDFLNSEEEQCDRILRDMLVGPRVSIDESVVPSSQIVCAAENLNPSSQSIVRQNTSLLPAKKNMPGGAPKLLDRNNSFTTPDSQNLSKAQNFVAAAAQGGVSSRVFVQPQAATPLENRNKSMDMATVTVLPGGGREIPLNQKIVDQLITSVFRKDENKTQAEENEAMKRDLKQLMQTITKLNLDLNSEKQRSKNLQNNVEQLKASVVSERQQNLQRFQSQHAQTEAAHSDLKELRQILGERDLQLLKYSFIDIFQIVAQNISQALSPQNWDLETAYVFLQKLRASFTLILQGGGVNVEHLEEIILKEQSAECDRISSQKKNHSKKNSNTTINSPEKSKRNNSSSSQSPPLTHLQEARNTCKQEKLRQRKQRSISNKSSAPARGTFTSHSCSEHSSCTNSHYHSRSTNEGLPTSKGEEDPQLIAASTVATQAVVQHRRSTMASRDVQNRASNADSAAVTVTATAPPSSQQSSAARKNQFSHSSSQEDNSSSGKSRSKAVQAEMERVQQNLQNIEFRSETTDQIDLIKQRILERKQKRRELSSRGDSNGHHDGALKPVAACALNKRAQQNSKETENDLIIPGFDEDKENKQNLSNMRREGISPLGTVSSFKESGRIHPNLDNGMQRDVNSSDYISM